MRRRFVDSNFLLAAFNPDDELHEMAMALSRHLKSTGAVYVTTELVLVEFLALVRRMGGRIRVKATDYVREIQNDPDITIVEHSRATFQRALDLYAARTDKAYSLTDCVSMVICRDLEITDVLTRDKDFAQEGFRALLREPL